MANPYVENNLFKINQAITAFVAKNDLWQDKHLWVSLYEQLLYEYKIELSDQFTIIKPAFNAATSQLLYLSEENYLSYEEQRSRQRLSVWTRNERIPLDRYLVKLSTDFNIVTLQQIFSQIHKYDVHDLKVFLQNNAHLVDHIQVNQLCVQYKFPPVFKNELTTSQIDYIYEHYSDEESLEIDFGYILTQHSEDHYQKSLALWQKAVCYDQEQQIQLNFSGEILQEFKKLYINLKDIGVERFMNMDCNNPKFDNVKEYLIWDILKIIPEQFIPKVFKIDQDIVQFCGDINEWALGSVLNFRGKFIWTAQEIQQVLTLSKQDGSLYFDQIYLGRQKYENILRLYTLLDIELAKKFIVMSLVKMTGYYLDDAMSALLTFTGTEFYLVKRLEQNFTIHFNDTTFYQQIKAVIPQLEKLWSWNKKNESDFLAWFIVTISMNQQQDYELYKDRLLPLHQNMINAIFSLLTPKMSIFMNFKSKYG